MRLRPVIPTLALALAAGAAQADEGMWMPSQLPQLAKELKAAGFKGNPADLADLTRHPMSAVVSLGGCTASFLLVTTHLKKTQIPRAPLHLPAQGAMTVPIVEILLPAPLCS